MQHANPELQLINRRDALRKLPYLAAEGCHHVEQVLVGPPDIPTEEAHDAEHLAAEQDRKGKGRVQPFTCGGISVRHLRVLGDIWSVYGRTACPYSAEDSAP